MFRPPEYAALINPIACNAFAMRCEGRNDLEQTLVVDTGLTLDGTPINAVVLDATTQSQVCDAKLFVCPFIKLLTPVSPDYAGRFFLARFTFSIDGEQVVKDSAVEMHLVCPACQIAVQPSPDSPDASLVRLLLGQSEDEVLGCCQMFFLPNGTRMVATLSGIPTGAGPIRINPGAILANYTPIDKKVIAKMTRTRFATRLRPAMAQPWIDVYAEFGEIPASFRAIDLVR